MSQLVNKLPSKETPCVKNTANPWNTFVGYDCSVVVISRTSISKLLLIVVQSLSADSLSGKVTSAIMN